MSIIGSPDEKTIPVGYLVFPERFFKEKVIQRPAEIIEKKPEEKPPATELVAEEKPGLGKYIPWIILGILLLTGEGGK